MKNQSRLLLVFFIIVAFVNLYAISRAYAIVVLRDDEIESFFKTISYPVLKTAELSPEDVSIILVGDDAVNAYVAGGQNIFIYSGLIEKTETVDEIVGVIAHEAGHIASGHLARSKGAMEQMSYQTILSTVLGVAVGVLSGHADAAAGISSGGMEIARRTFLKNSRTFEASADQAALSYLHRSGYSANGLLTFLEKLADQDVLVASQQDEYIMTHPISHNRIEYIKNSVANEKNAQQWSKNINNKYQRIKAKIIAYQHPERIERLYGSEVGVVSNYAMSIAAFRIGDTPKAVKLIDELITKEPNNPYFYEFKGQILFENGKIDEAITNYKKAYDMLPLSSLIGVALGHALIEKNKKGYDEEAIQIFHQALRQEKHEPSIYRFLSIAYGRNDNEGLAMLCLAEEAYLNRDYLTAGQMAKSSQKYLKIQTPAWNRAQDLIRLVKDTKI